MSRTEGMGRGAGWGEMRPPALQLRAARDAARGPLGRLGPYRLERLFAIGGQSELYLATARGEGEPLYLKRCRADRSGPALRALLLQEGRILKALSPSMIPAPTVIYQEPPEPALIFPYAPTVTLHRLLQEGPVSGGEGLALIAQLLSQLASLHAGEGLEQLCPDQELVPWVHGDLGAHNLIVGWTGRLQLIDLGCARPCLPPRALDQYLHALHPALRGELKQLSSARAAEVSLRGGGHAGLSTELARLKSLGDLLLRGLPEAQRALQISLDTSASRSAGAAGAPLRQLADRFSRAESIGPPRLARRVQPMISRALRFS